MVVGVRWGAQHGDRHSQLRQQVVNGLVTLLAEVNGSLVQRVAGQLQGRLSRHFPQRVLTVIAEDLLFPLGEGGAVAKSPVHFFRVPPLVLAPADRVQGGVDLRGLGELVLVELFGEYDRVDQQQALETPALPGTGVGHQVASDRMAYPHRVPQVEPVQQLLYVSGHKPPVHLAVAFAAAVKTQVHGVHVHTRQAPGDLVPAATVKAGGVQQQHGAALPRPLGDSQGYIGQVYLVHIGLWHGTLALSLLGQQPGPIDTPGLKRRGA